MAISGIQSLSQNSPLQPTTPDKISQQQAAFAWQHMMVLQSVHQILTQLKNQQHIFKQQ